MIDRGKLLELRLHYLLWNMGYFVRRNIKLVLEKGVEITDIDVYGIKFEELLRPTKIAIECKHQESGFGNILKLRGISDYYGIDFPILVREKISIPIHDFMRSLGVMGFTHSHLSDIERHLDLKSESYETFEKHDPKWLHSVESGVIIEDNTNELSSNRETKQLIWELYESWMIRDPYKRYIHLRYSYNNLKKLISDKYDGDMEKSLKWLTFEIIILSTLSCIEMASSLFDVPTYHKKDKLVTNLLGGEVSSNEKKNIVNIVREIIEVTGLDIDKTKFNLEQQFTPELYELIKELMKHPVLCQTYLRFVDYEIYSYVLKENEVDLDVLKKLFNISSKEIDLFSKWNMLLIKSLGDDRKIPVYLTPLV